MWNEFSSKLLLKQKVNCKLKLKKYIYAEALYFSQFVKNSWFFSLFQAYWTGTYCFSGGWDGLWKKISIWILFFFFCSCKKKVNWIDIAVLMGNWMESSFLKLTFSIEIKKFCFAVYDILLYKSIIMNSVISMIYFDRNHVDISMQQYNVGIKLKVY